MNEIEDRRQRAREAYHDNGGAPDARGKYAPIEMAIEIATQVKITPEILASVYPDLPSGDAVLGVVRLTRTLAVLGFEVVD